MGNTPHTAIEQPREAGHRPASVKKSTYDLPGIDISSDVASARQSFHAAAKGLGRGVETVGATVKVLGDLPAQTVSALKETTQSLSTAGQAAQRVWNGMTSVAAWFDAGDSGKAQPSARTAFQNSAEPLSAQKPPYPEPLDPGPARLADTAATAPRINAGM